MRRRHFSLAALLGAIAALAPRAAVGQATTPLRLSRAEFSHATRSERLVLGYALTAANRGGIFGIRFEFLRDDGGGRQTTIAAIPKEPDGAPSLIELKQGSAASGVLSVTPGPGLYRSFTFRLLECPDGKAIRPDRVAYDSAKDAKVGRIALGVTLRAAVGKPSGDAPGAAPSGPELATPKSPAVEPNANGTFTATCTVEVRVPADAPADVAYRVTAGGSLGAQEQWARTPAAGVLGGERRLSADFVFRDLKPGLYGADLELYDATGKRLQRLEGAFEVEVGGAGWVRQASRDKIPPRLRVRAGRWQTLAGAPFDFFAASPAAGVAARFVRGGNYGNSIFWTMTPDYNTQEYFGKLRAIGCRFMRLSFNQERYPDDEKYRRAVDQIVQNIMAAGMYPIINPQGLPKGADRAQQAERGLRVVEAMARQYRGLPVWISVCNEPHEFGSWAEWRPVAVRYVRAIRAIDPDAFVIVPFEGLSKDGRGAARDPIAEVAVDLYDAHAYVQPGDLQTLFAPAIRAGLPVLLGEYGGGAGYLAKMHAAFEGLTGVMGIAPWAFTRYGMDAMPLIQDGKGPVLRFTASGQDVANAYAAWEQGRSVRGGQ